MKLLWLKNWREKRMFNRGFQHCPKCGEWKPKDAFPRSRWCMVCEWELRNDVLEAIGWFYIYSMGPDSSEFRTVDAEQLRENMERAIRQTNSLPVGAAYKWQMLDALSALSTKLRIDICVV